MIPAKALTYGTPFNISPASFAIFDTVSTMFIVVDTTYSWWVVDGRATECVEGNIGSPWATMVLDEPSNTMAWGEFIVTRREGMLAPTNLRIELWKCHEAALIDTRAARPCEMSRPRRC
jgi:hypothetical protein